MIIIFKKAASQATLFLLCIYRFEMKNVQLLLFFAGDNVYFPSLCLYKANFLTKEEIPLYIRFSKLLYGKEKITLVCFKQTHVVKDAKKLIKLIAAVSNHLTRYKCKMMHCLLKHLSISQQLFLMIIKSIR